jgi:hypothetical protein
MTTWRDAEKYLSSLWLLDKDIKNNNHRAGQKNLWSARYFKWGAVHFTHEYVFSIQKGK